MGDLEERVSKFLQTGGGASWLPDDMIGSTFKFEQDREVGKKKIADMIEAQVTYFTFLMNKLPVEADNYDGTPGNFNSAMCIQCGDSNGETCYKRRIEAAIFYFLTPQVQGGGALINKGGYAMAPVKRTRQTFTMEQIPQLAQMLITILANAHNSSNYVNTVQQSVINDDNHAVYICFPMGNEVPLRMAPLSANDIKIVGNNWSVSYPNTAYVKPGGAQATTEAELPAPECMKYKLIANYPIEVFGWKKNSQQYKYMNSLMCDYCYYLTNPQTSFEEFNFPIPEVIEPGTSGNPKPPRCLLPDANCAEWEAEGWDSYEDWIKFVTENQTSTLSPEDIALVNTVDIVENCEELFTAEYLDYGKNPEFMPLFEQIPQWRFSNACQDALKYQKVLGSGNTRFYFTEEAYEFLVSALVQARWEGFTNECINATINNRGHDYRLFGTDAVLADLNTTEFWGKVSKWFADKDTNPEAHNTFNLLPGDREINKIVNQETNSVNASPIEVYIKRRDKFKEILKSWFLLPETFFIGDNKDVHYMSWNDVAKYLNNIYNVYEDALDKIKNFNPAANSSDAPFTDCLNLHKEFEGIGMTYEQLKNYQSVLQGIFAFDWDGRALELFNEDLEQFNTQANDINWVNNNPIAAWFRDTFYKKFIIPLMDGLVGMSVALDIALTALMIASGAGPVFVFLAGLAMVVINTTWQTMAPPGSLFHHDTALTPEQIAEEFGIQLGIFFAAEGAGALLRNYGNTMSRMASQAYGFIAGKSSKAIGSLVGIGESVLEKIKSRRQAISNISQTKPGAAAELADELAKLRTIRGRISGLEKDMKLIEKNYDYAAAKNINTTSLQQISERNEAIAEASTDIKNLPKDAPIEDELRLKEDLLEARSKYLEAQGRNFETDKELYQIQRELSGDFVKNAEFEAAMSARLEAVKGQEVAFRLLEEANATKKALSDANKFGTDYDDATALASKRFDEYLEAKRLVYQKYNEGIDILESLAPFNLTKKIEEEIAALRAELTKVTETFGGIVRGEAGVTRDLTNMITRIERSSTKLDEANKVLESSIKEYDDVTKTISNLTSPEQLTEALAERATKAYEALAAARANVELFQGQIISSSFTANMLAALSQAFPKEALWLKEWAKFSANFYNAMLEATKITTEAIAAAQEFAWTINEAATATAAIIQMMTQWFGYRAVIDMPAFIPPEGEGYPIIDADSPNIELEIELLRLKVDYLEPWQEAYVLVEAYSWEIIHMVKGINWWNNWAADCNTRPKADCTADRAKADAEIAKLNQIITDMKLNRDELLEDYRKYILFLASKYNTDMFTEEMLAAQAAAWGDKPGSPAPPAAPGTPGGQAIPTNFVLPESDACKQFKQKYLEDNGTNPTYDELPVECRTDYGTKTYCDEWRAKFIRDNDGKEPGLSDIINMPKMCRKKEDVITYCDQWKANYIKNNDGQEPSIYDYPAVCWTDDMCNQWKINYRKNNDGAEPREIDLPVGCRNK